MKLVAGNKKLLTTDAILEATANRPLHLRPRDELAELYVSGESRWSDRRWVFENATRGSRANSSTISWDLNLPDGANLCDPQHTQMLDWLKRFVWSAYAAPGDGVARFKPGTLGQLSVGLRDLVAWCVKHHLSFPSQMTREVVNSYIDDLRSQANDEGNNENLTAAVAWNRLRVWTLLWKQRHEMERFGIAPMPDAPFGLKGALAVANEIGAVAAGSYRPVPSEVGLPILNTAMKMLDTPAQDILQLRDLCAEAYTSGRKDDGGPPDQSPLGKHRQLAAALNYSFTKVDGQPWHPPLDPSGWDRELIVRLSDDLKVFLERCEMLPLYDFEGRRHVDLRKIILSMGYPAGTEFYLAACSKMHTALATRARREGLVCPYIRPMGRVLKLVKAIVSAAQVVIQGTVGFRISEVCGLKSGIDSGTGLPRCVHVRDTVTGLAEVFVVTTDLSKTEETPRTEEWTVGYRPKGSTEIPPAVRAMLVVDRLLAPYRDLLGTDDLFVNVRSKQGLPKGRSGVGRVSSEALIRTMREFVSEWVDLSGLPDEAARKTMDQELVPWRESHGRMLKTHQWRKSFAHFAYMVDPSMLPVLQAHFHHVSIAMTDGGYLNHAVQLGDMNDIKRQKVAILALEIARGGSELAGRNGDELERKILKDLKPEIDGASIEDAYRSAFLYVEQAGLHRMFFEPYGICGARSASEMACHKEAGTEALARWRPDLAPNYATRTPSLCAGCPSFAIARWHLPFWEDRYVESVFAVRQYEVLKLDLTYMGRANELMYARARQAAALCRKFGADIAALDTRVEKQLEGIRNAS